MCMSTCIIHTESFVKLREKLVIFVASQGRERVG